MEAEPHSQGRTQMVPAPMEHQGARSALRNSFDCGKDIPADFARLLDRIR